MTMMLSPLFDLNLILVCYKSVGYVGTTAVSTLINFSALKIGQIEATSQVNVQITLRMQRTGEICSRSSKLSPCLDFRLPGKANIFLFSF